MAKPNTNYTIGIDIGGTKMSGVLFDGEKVLADYTLATPQDNLEHFLIMLKAVVEPLLEKSARDKVTVKGLGLGVAGPLDKTRQIILNPPNIKILDRINLVKQLKNRFNYSVKMDNDVNCFVRAEALLGAGKKYSNIFGLTVGTGIGGGWWYNGGIYIGSHAVTQPAWQIIDAVNGLSLEQVYQKLMQNSPAASAEEAYRGDVLAQKIYEEFGRYLGITLASMVNLIDPQVIIIGGGVVESSDLFLAKTKKVMKQFILSPEARKVKIIKGKLGPLAGAMGAALLVTHNS